MTRLPLALLLLPLLLLAGTLAAPEARAQWAAVRGQVVDADDGQPLPGVNVVLRGDDGVVGVTTNVGGQFVVSRLAPGRYVLQASFVGYEPHADTLALDFEDQRTLRIALQADAAELDEVVVETERATTADGGAGFRTVRPADLVPLSAPGLAPDLASYLLFQPGFTAAGDQGGQLFVRGGTSTQNLVLIDGMPVYQPLHIVGSYSVVPAELVSFADVYAGGFGARYGGRIASVIDVNTRNGNKRRVAGSASVAPLLATVRLETPVVPGRASLLVSARESVIERVAPDLTGGALPYRFGDRFAKLHAFLSQTSHLSLTALRAFDEGRVAGVLHGPGDAMMLDTEQIAWRNEAYGGRYFYLAPSFPVLTELYASVSRLETTYGPPAEPVRTASAGGFNAGINFGYLLGSWEVHFGFFGASTRYAYDLEDVRAREEFVAEGGAFLDQRIELGRGVRLEPGLRLHSFPSRSQLFLEPRLRAAWRLGGPGGRHRVSAAWGVFHQQVMGLTNERDATDVFTAWTPTPDNRDVPRARHLIAGWEAVLTPALRLRLEGYDKALRHLAFPQQGAGLTEPDRFLRLDGTSRGLDVQLTAQVGAWRADLGYGRASVWYEGEGARFRPPHDRRHQLTAGLGGAWKAVTVRARWQYASGRPFTPAIGFYDAGRPATATVDALLERGPTRVAFGDPFSHRLPAYHRLDVSAAYTARLRAVRMTVEAGVVNAYDHDNLFDVDVATGARVDQLPLVPTLGLKIDVP